uniref:Uncharacterized protein n=1 Tax=Naja naja TaxID=35670 RepID=A0A8C6Y989_NAJNA
MTVLGKSLIKPLFLPMTASCSLLPVKTELGEAMHGLPKLHFCWQRTARGCHRQKRPF